jgi:hypothetical protein
MGASPVPGYFQSYQKINQLCLLPGQADRSSGKSNDFANQSISAPTSQEPATLTSKKFGEL